MGKKTDDKKTRKALARVRRTLRKKETLEGDAALSDWEDEFIDSLETRLEKFGSAFADPEKGDAAEALSYRQAAKLREVEKKAKGKGRKPLKRSSFKPKKPAFRKPLYDRDEDFPEEDSRSTAKACRCDSAPPPPERPTGPPKLTVISGGKKKSS
ncbi:MAG: hypothetical protein COA84_08275 [Robiginitomaculum sp.]|nr:MAG: hypothetical protein COA84_08275 [Robiginitomaculum sp.]